MSSVGLNVGKERNAAMAAGKQSSTWGFRAFSSVPTSCIRTLEQSQPDAVTASATRFYREFWPRLKSPLFAAKKGHFCFSGPHGACNPLKFAMDRDGRSGKAWGPADKILASWASLHSLSLIRENHESSPKPSALLNADPSRGGTVEPLSSCICVHQC